ncbi:MAG: 5-dehydro-4-deoxy-D-glucuronate isomerase, partial [Bacteroidales bacterium]|nr:5-dehydro-4-deoxy-D-glucuronate isomerase [Bacteroidales bacterium]
MKFNERYAVHPKDFKKFDTDRIRKEFLVKEVFVKDEICLTYSLYDRYIVGGANPVNKKLELESFDSLKADSFLARREMGVINVGGKGKIVADGETYELGYKEALYLGKETSNVVFESSDAKAPAKFYINSAPAHKKFPNKLVTLADAEVVELGALES